LAGERLEDAARRLTVLGAPAARGSITPGRCDLAPAAIRKALERFSTYHFGSGCDVRRVHVSDAGDLEISSFTPEQAFEPIRAGLERALERADAVVLLGGDNSITRPGCHALGDLSRCALVTLDAHLDLRYLDEGLTNGNPVRALLRDGLPGDHIFQIGIQSFANSAPYAAVAREAGIHVITAECVMERGIAAVLEEALRHLDTRVDRIYIDLDLDVLDRIYAPATPGSRPGGLTPHHVRQAARMCGEHPKVRVMDLVEMDPTQDVAGATGLTAAACLLEFAVGLAGRTRG
jgi:formiminoglutamase